MARQPSETATGEALSAAVADAGRLARDHKLTYIDSMRGVAILLVIIVHHGQRFTGLPLVQTITGLGQIGVQLFFFASAFTLCMSNDQRQQEPHPTASFFIRRTFRIAPLYYFGILFYGVLDVAMRILRHQAVASSYTPVNVGANLLFVHGFVKSANNSIVPGGWSIGTEMAFYAMFPLLFSAFLSTRRCSITVRLFCGILASLVLNLVVQWFASAAAGEPVANNSFMYYNIVNQLPVFLIGMLVYAQVMRKGRFRQSPARDIPLFALFMGLAAWLVTVPGSIAPIALPPVAAIAGAFLLNILRSRSPRVGLLERIGQLSYSMYIFHFVFAGMVTTAVLRLFGDLPVREAILYLPTLALTVGCTMLVAMGSKRLIEDPCIDIGKKWIRARDARPPVADAKPASGGLPDDDGREYQ